MEPGSDKISYIDSHAHLDFSDFDQDREAVIQNACLAKVAAIINIGINLKTSIKSIELAETNNLIYATVGIHPHDSGAMQKNHWQKLIQLYQHPKVVAVGEIGLDFYRDYSPREVQKEVFLHQLDLAVEHKLPVIIHTRNAWAEILPIMMEQYRGKLNGVFHCFSGSEDQARKLLDLGYYISFTGVVTFKNSSALKIAAEYVPFDRLLLETDCPFMAPAPFRGKRCEPAHVPFIAQKIADAKKVAVSEVARQTTENVGRLFGIHVGNVDS